MRVLQIRVFRRDTLTGELSAALVDNVEYHTSAVGGHVAGFVLSETNNQVVLALTSNDSGTIGGVVVLDISVRTMTNSAPTCRRSSPCSRDVRCEVLMIGARGCECTHAHDSHRLTKPGEHRRVNTCGRALFAA